MRVNLKQLLLSLITGALLASCAPLEQLCEPYSTVSESRGARIYKATESIYSKLQSNQKRMLFGSVVYEDGRPVISLSKEDAKSLGVSEELYDDCVSSIANNEVL